MRYNSIFAKSGFCDYPGTLLDWFTDIFLHVVNSFPSVPSKIHIGLKLLYGFFLKLSFAGCIQRPPHTRALGELSG